MNFVGLLILLGFIPALCFPVIYAFSPWFSLPDGRPNIVGRSLMNLSCVIALALGLAVIRTFDLVELERLAFVRFGIYALITAALWGQLVVLLMVRSGRYRSREYSDDDMDLTKTGN